MPEYTPELRAEVDTAMAKALKTRDACRYYSMSSFKDTPEADDVLNLAMWAVPLLTAHIDAQAERIAELDAENARLREGLETLKQWSNGYPVNRFGEPNLAAVKKLLSDANMLVQMDRMHASWARYLAEYVGGVVDAALKDTAQ